MNVVRALFVAALIYSASGSWLGDVFTGLDEAAKDVKLKAKFKKFGEEVVKNGKDIADKVLEVVPRADWVNETKEFLHKVKFSEVLKGKSSKTMDEIVTRWNNLLKDLNNEKKFKDASEMFLKITQEIKDLLPKPLYKKWENEIHSVKEKVKKVVSAVNIEKLRSTIQKWTQPSFMSKEDLQKERKILKEAVHAVTEKLKKKTEDEDEEEIKKFLKEKVVKPHHKSGSSKWKKLMKHLPIKDMLKNHKSSLSTLKNKILKLTKDSKDATDELKETVETKVVVLDGEGPLMITEDDTKKLKMLPSQKRKAFEEAELNWERKVLRQAEKLARQIAKRKSKSTPKPTTETTPTTIPTKKTTKEEGRVTLTGNEDWDKDLVAWDKEDEDNEMDDVDDAKTSQSTRARLNNDQFTKKFADQEVEWYNIKKELAKKMKMFSG